MIGPIDNPQITSSDRLRRRLHEIDAALGGRVFPKEAVRLHEQRVAIVTELDARRARNDADALSNRADVRTGFGP